MNYEFEKLYEDDRWKQRSLAIRDGFEFNYEENPGWICSECEKSFSKQHHLLHAHHTYYWAGEPPWSDKYEVGDIIPVCYECHKKIHDTQKIEIKMLPNSNYNYSYCNYFEEFERLKREEESEWMKLWYSQQDDKYNYHRVEDVKSWKEKSKGDKIRYGQYASKMCNYLGINVKKVPMKFWIENSYPDFILKFIIKRNLEL